MVIAGLALLARVGPGQTQGRPGPAPCLWTFPCFVGTTLLEVAGEIQGSLPALTGVAARGRQVAEPGPCDARAPSAGVVPTMGRVHTMRAGRVASVVSDALRPCGFE